MQPAARSRPRLLALALVVALVLAACGDSSGGRYGNRGETDTAGGGAGANTPPPPNAEQGTTFVSVASVSGLGLVLADSGGRTLYAFSADRGGESSCYGSCAAAWPPLLTEGEPHPSNGASAAKLGTSKRRNGDAQVTYANLPLYTYAGDKGPGEANGNGIRTFGGAWTALKPNGQPAS